MEGGTPLCACWGRPWLCARAAPGRDAALNTRARSSESVCLVHGEPFPLFAVCCVLLVRNG